MTDIPRQTIIPPGFKDIDKSGRWSDQQIMDDAYTLLATIFYGNKPLTNPEVQKRWNELHHHLGRRVLTGPDYKPPGPNE